MNPSGSQFSVLRPLRECLRIKMFRIGIALFAIRPVRLGGGWERKDRACHRLADYSGHRAD